MKNKKEFSLIRQKNLKGLAFSTQMIIAATVTIIFPLVFSVILSFTDLKMNLNGELHATIDNYKWVFHEDASGFWRATSVSLAFSLVSTAVQTVLGFLLAVMLYFLSRRLQGIFRTLIYLPVILPSAVVSAMWIMMFSGDENGILNILFGLQDPPFQWMGKDILAFLCLVVTNTWHFVGITTVIYLVNMSNVSPDIIEAARLDGANKFQLMTRVILPLTRSATTLNIIMSIIGGVKSFDLFYLFQTNGNLSTNLTPVALLIYRIGIGSTDIKNISLSKSVTMAIILAVILGGVTLLVNYLAKRKEGARKS